MNELILIKENDYVKYFKNIYLVKDFKELEKGRYRLSFYFRSIKKKNAKLYKDDSSKINGYLARKIKKATPEEIKFLHSRIRLKFPHLDLPSIENSEELKNRQELNETDCVEFLKSKGYLVFKQL